MDALIVYPKNEEQLVALKAVMTAMKVTFEQKPETFPDYVIAGVKESIAQAGENNLTSYKGVNEMLDLK